MKRSLTPTEEIASIRAKFKRFTYDSTPKEWMDTGSARLNAVLGSETLGVPFGKIIEAYGEESQGKTMLALFLAHLAQKQDADVGWIDLEQSWDPDWSFSQGVNPDAVYLFQIQLLKIPIGKSGKFKTRLQTIEELLEEAEDWMRRRHRAGRNRLFMVVDSVTAMLPESEAKAGISNQSMFTNFALSKLMGTLLRRWVALAATYNCTVLFVNQKRIKPGVTYGDPETTTGGRALKFYASVRVRVSRAGKGRGRMILSGRVIGLKGVIQNIKNKAGGGSLEGASCGFFVKFGNPKWKFVSVKNPKKEE